MPRTPGNAGASDRSLRRPVRVAPWPAGGPRDRVGHRVPGHWAGMAGAWACPAGRTTEAGKSCLNAAPPGFRDPGRIPPNGRSPRGGQRSLPAARRLSPGDQQPVPARWRPRMASLNKTCTETHPAPYPRHDPVNDYQALNRLALDPSDHNSLDVIPLSKKERQDQWQDCQYSLCHGLLNFSHVA